MAGCQNIFKLNFVKLLIERIKWAFGSQPIADIAPEGKSLNKRPSEFIKLLRVCHCLWIRSDFSESPLKVMQQINAIIIGNKFKNETNKELL